jgi:predicted N-acetyltransferase YhbS
MIVRPEAPEDYAAIADVHARAFGNRAAEAAFVALHRQRPEFVPQLALVAEDAGRVVGHVLFSPRTIRLLGEDVRAVNLAPIAVEPSRQGGGIGGALVEEGHREAAAEGFTVSFLRGHATYYPRFGYQTGAYGFWVAEAPVGGLPSPALQEGSVTPADVPALQALRRSGEAEVDFSLDPGLALLDWISPNPAIEAIVYRHEAEIAGYTRFDRSKPHQPRIFLARDPEIACQIAASLAARSQTEVLRLPLHPLSAAAPAFPSPSGEPSKAAMARSLRPSPLEEYMRQERAGQRPVGQVIWPVEFDL